MRPGASAGSARRTRRRQRACGPRYKSFEAPRRRAAVQMLPMKRGSEGAELARQDCALFITGRDPSGLMTEENCQPRAFEPIDGFGQLAPVIHSGQRRKPRLASRTETDGNPIVDATDQVAGGGVQCASWPRTARGAQVHGRQMYDIDLRMGQEDWPPKQQAADTT